MKNISVISESNCFMHDVIRMDDIELKKYIVPIDLFQALIIEMQSNIHTCIQLSQWYIYKSIRICYSIKSYSYL